MSFSQKILVIIQFCKKCAKRVFKTVKFEGGTYHVNLSDKLRIVSHEICGLFNRQFHRISEIVVRDNRYTLSIVLVLWIVFILISWYWGLQRNGAFSLGDAIWDARNPFFTSVVVVVIVNAYGRAKVHRTKLYTQHQIYVNLMRGFDVGLFESFIDGNLCNYMPFYCKKTLDDTLAYCHHCFEEKQYLDATDYDFTQRVSNLNSELSRAEDAFNHDSFVGIWDPVSALTLIREIEDKLENIRISQKLYYFDLQDISVDFLLLTDMMRRPWRWNIKNKMKILKILSKYPNNLIADDFYYTMLLSGHEFPDKVPSYDQF